MITGLVVLLTCQLVGEFVVRVFDLPIPGPVLGMVLLLVVLRIRHPGPEAGVVRAADALLRHLQLLFIPAGVGLIEYLHLISDQWIPIVVGLCGSWLFATVLTASVGTAMLAVESRFKRRTGRAGGTSE